IMAQRVSFPNLWAVAAPLLLLLTFVVLLTLVLRHKYGKIEYNWLLTLSGLFVCLYLVLFYVKVLHIFHRSEERRVGQEFRPRCRPCDRRQKEMTARIQ